MGVKEVLKKNKLIGPVVWKLFYKNQAKKEYTANKQLCDRLLTLKDKHKGEKCFIIGTGPSLTSDDLDVLKENNIPCFGTHRIFTTFETTKWRPTYYVAQDYALIENNIDKIKAIEAEIKILPAYFAEIFGRDKDKMYFVLREYEDSADKIHFSSKINQYICQGFTVAYASIQLAVWMGFSEIYLLGVDHNYSTYMSKDGKVVSTDVKNNYFGNEDYTCDTLPRLDDSSRGYLKAKEYCDAHEVKIFNATRGGKLEVFPRVNFDELFK
ncbi:MAG: 6-hydroxymethylpterin diphosphokinase MptE-like protein [Ruminococcus sp.]